MKNILLAFFSCFLLSCGTESSPEKKTVPASTQTKKPNDRQVLLKRIKALDTLTPAGNFLKYSLDTNNKVVVTVGNNHFQRSFKSAQFSEPGVYTYKNEWKSYVGLHNSCGSTCWTLTLLPLAKKGRLITYDYDIASDSKTNLLFCKKRLEGNEYYVTNIQTSKKKKITLSGISGMGFVGNGIDSVAFVNGNLYVKWELAAGTDKKGKTKKEVFKLNI
jgi:hypothetical protein